jgi:hypothetical protein
MYYLGYVFNYVILDIRIIPPRPNRVIIPNNYGRTLMSAIPQDITPNPHTNLLNVYIQIANKIGFQPKKICVAGCIFLMKQPHSSLYVSRCHGFYKTYDGCELTAVNMPLFSRF